MFMTAVSIFEIPALLGAGSGKVPVLASEIFYAVRPAGPESLNFAYGVAGVYGILLAVPSLAALSYYLRKLARAERYQVITGRGYRPRTARSGRRGRSNPNAYAYSCYLTFGMAGDPRRADLYIYDGCLHL